MTEREALLADILQRIIAQTNKGPGVCMGREGNGAVVWKGSFRSLLGEASEAVGLLSASSNVNDIGFGISRSEEGS